MIKKYSYLLFLMLLVGLNSCFDDPKPKDVDLDPKVIEQQLAEVHKQNIKVEDQQIDDYLNRRNWDFKRAKSGLRYNIYKDGIGLYPQEGQRVVLEYTVSLIRGDLIYDSKVDGVKIFTVDRDDEPTGLHEAIKLLRVGAKAKVILPSYLAYGLIGDENKIPPSATLFYDLYLKEVH